MASQVLHMPTSAYLKGIPLPEIIFRVADTESMKEYNKSSESTLPEMPKKAEGALDLLNIAVTTLHGLQKGQDRRKEIENKLKKRVLEFVKNGDLIAFGFKMPRNVEDQAIKIPPDLFFGGEINWNKSELKSQNLEFSGIRVFKNSNPVIDLIPNNSNNSQKKIQNKPENAKKPNFSDLDPELHIGEAEAAKFLGISPRTLQGYRLNGGGPEYLKLKKAVRYKISELKNWTENKQKKNTSEY